MPHWFADTLVVEALGTTHVAMRAELARARTPPHALPDVTVRPTGVSVAGSRVTLATRDMTLVLEER